MKAKIPFVFYIDVKYCPQWFSYFWKNRGANYFEFQFWKIRVDIGMPWHKSFVENIYHSYNNFDYIHNANSQNLKNGLFSFLINKTYKL